MKYKTNYEILHVSELEQALKNIDETNNYEEAEYIRSLIRKGGYKYPKPSVSNGSEITGKSFKISWKTNVAVILGWVTIGTLFRWYNLLDNPYLAGGTFFIFTLSNLMIFYAPIVNILILRRQNKKGDVDFVISVVLTGISVAVLTFLLAITGMFAFT